MKKLGFGCMRLPTLVSGDPTSIDYPTIEALFDRFLAQGFTYFDTAYTYHGYHGEEAVRKALVERHPREAFQLATKLPLRDFKDEPDMEAIFNEQLKNCGVEYFDYYLLHNMGRNVYDKCCQYDAFHFVAEKKAQGKIRNVGMSFHDMPELLEEILKKYGDCLDFIQLQINYVDWKQPNVQSQRCLEIANKYNKPVSVMEPIKGGTLANVSDEVKATLAAVHPEASPARWALRFAASQEGVFMVLSGMNAMDQLEDNMAALGDFKLLNEEEQAAIWKAADIINAQTAIPCTGCEYCTHGCPKHIAIPQFFALYNSIARTTGSFSSQGNYYNNTALRTGSKAGDCIGCGACEEACPQNLPIREHLKTVAAQFDNHSFPTRK